MTRVVATISATVLLLVSSNLAVAEIYKWVDEFGNAHFTDKPPQGKRVEELKLQINTYSAVEIAPLTERLGRKDKVVIYSTSWCGNCRQAKQYFRENNIPYVAYDVEKSRTGKIDFKLLKGTSVPIIILDGTRMNGFTVARFDALYQKYLRNKAEEKASAEGG